jgi:hypothetical protein
MFCSNCGTKGDVETQFCRSCGEDLRFARGGAVETTPLSAAKGDIGRAFAERIDSITNAKELKTVAHEVLPQIEKFLESPDQKRLRGIRTGSIVSFVGLGVAIGFLIAANVDDPELIVLSALGVVTFFIGLALMINGLFFTVPKQSEPIEGKSDAPQNSIGGFGTNELLMPPSARHDFSSVTEHTTRTLDSKIPIRKKDKFS